MSPRGALINVCTDPTCPIVERHEHVRRPGPRYWLVYSGYLGNGRETVLVQADDEIAARIAARDALIATVQPDLDNPKLREWRRTELTGRLHNYENSPLEAEEITLPWIGETS
jgi:hypothetical protein